MKNWEKRGLARRLRKQGLSYKEIRKKIPVSKSTVSQWCKDIRLTPRQLSRLDINGRKGEYAGSLKGAKSNQLKRAREIQRIKTISKSEISHLTKGEFKIAGLMLYWAEGSKKKYVDFSNSDSGILKFMMKWFRRICLVPNEKFRAQLHLHSGQNEIEMKKFWSKITGVPLPQFTKSYIKKEGSGHRKNNLYNGTLKVRICSSDLLHRILGWIDGVVEKGR